MKASRISRLLAGATVAIWRGRRIPAQTEMVARPVDAAATEEADIMGTERVEPYKRQVSRRSVVVGSGAKLAYASPLVAASFSLSPTFGYVQAAAYFQTKKKKKKKKRAKKSAPDPGQNLTPDAQAKPDPTGEPSGDPTTGGAKPERGATSDGNAGRNKKGNRDKTGSGQDGPSSPDDAPSGDGGGDDPA